MRLFEVPGSTGAEPYEDLPNQLAYFQARSRPAGSEFKEMAKEWIRDAGGVIEAESMEVGFHPVDALIKGRNGTRFLLLARGTPDGGPRAGLRRSDTVLKLGCRAVLIARRTDLPILVVTSHLPASGSSAGQILSDLHSDIFDVVALEGDLQGFHRIQRYLTELPPPLGPLPAPWKYGHAQASLFHEDGGDA